MNTHTQKNPCSAPQSPPPLFFIMTTLLFFPMKIAGAGQHSKKKKEEKQVFITLYTNEHTKSMKPHCILGSCSAQFLSIMGCWRQTRTCLYEETIEELCGRMIFNDFKGSIKGLRLVVDPKRFSPNHLAPRIQLRPSEPPEGNIRNKHSRQDGRQENVYIKYSVYFNILPFQSTATRLKPQRINFPLQILHSFDLPPAETFSFPVSFASYFFKRPVGGRRTHLALYLPGFGDS